MAKIVAREWLILLGSFLVGFVVVLPMIVMIFDETYAQFWRALTMQEEQKYFWRAFFLLLSPYLLVQFLRSIVWAIRTRHDSN